MKPLLISTPANRYGTSDAARCDGCSRAIPTPELLSIQETLIERGYAWKEISEEEFLAELSKQQVYFHRGGGFVGLARFVKFDLGGLGYDFGTAYDLARRLSNEQRVKIYHVDNPQDDHQTAAIRRINTKAYEDPVVLKIILQPKTVLAPKLLTALNSVRLCMVLGHVCQHWMDCVAWRYSWLSHTTN